MKCTYAGLTGIIIDEPFTPKEIRGVSGESWNKAIKYYVSDDTTGVASIFLGMNGLMEHSKIHNLDTKEIYDPKFKIEKGGFIPSITPCCWGEPKLRGKMPDSLQNITAIKEILNQSLGYLEGERKGRYFLMTPYKEGCCDFRYGVIEAKKKDILEILNGSPPIKPSFGIGSYQNSEFFKENHVSLTKKGFTI